MLKCVNLELLIKLSKKSSHIRYEYTERNVLLTSLRILNLKCVPLILKQV